MPFNYTVDHERRRVFVRVLDPIVVADLIGLVDRQAADGAWNYTRLEDLRPVNAWLPTSAELTELLGHIHTISGTHGVRGPIAFVIAQNSALFGMFRMYAILGEHRGETIGTFRSLIEATDWLDARARN